MFRSSTRYIKNVISIAGLAGLTLALMVVCAGCGIFAPREGIEPPESGSDSGDRIGIATILDNTGRRFFRDQYETIFADEFAYYHNGVWIRDKDDHIRVLELITDRYADLRVIWQSDTVDGTADSYFGIDSGTVYRRYYIWKDGTNYTRTPNDYFGTARFSLKERGGVWSIVRWRDESVSGFFASIIW